MSKIRLPRFPRRADRHSQPPPKEERSSGEEDARTTELSWAEVSAPGRPRLKTTKL